MEIQIEKIILNVIQGNSHWLLFDFVGDARKGDEYWLRLGVRLAHQAVRFTNLTPAHCSTSPKCRGYYGSTVFAIVKKGKTGLNGFQLLRKQPDALPSGFGGILVSLADA